MRNEMQQIRQLSLLLDQTDDPDERDRIQDEISLLEEYLEEMDDYEYRSNSNAKYFD